MADVLIRTEGVSVLYGGQAALSGVNLAIREKEHTILSGGNGAGKSTLMRLLRGEIYPSRGSVLWRTPGGMDASPLSGRAMTALLSAGQMEHYSRRAWGITGEEILLTGISDTSLFYSKATDEERAAVVTMARLFKIEPLLARELAHLSQGQLSILLLARACMRKPEVLLLDEFTNALDTQACRRVVGILEMLAEDRTLVLATYRRSILPREITRETALEKGNIVHDGPLRARTSQKNTLAGQHPFPDGPRARGNTTKIPPLIDIRDATVYLGRLPVLHSVNWSIRQGEHWAVLGENGAGKSTLLRLAAGEEYPAVGGVVFRHTPYGTPVSDQETLRKGVRLLSDALQANYAYNLPGLDLVLSGFEASIGTYREYLPEELAEARERIRLVSGSRSRENLEARPIRSLSTGELRRLLLARALVGAPYLLLLDEPFSGLDEAARRHMRDLLEDIAATGTQLAMVSHHESDLPACITHALRLDRGRVMGAEVRKRP